MDSVTQFALGASIGEAVLGRKVGKRAALTGGVVATLPDLDTFIPWDDAVATFTYHRSASHSLLMLTLVSPLVGWLVLKSQQALRPHARKVYLMVFLALFTHPLLDGFTVYGTQLFWPLTAHPVSGSTIFIVDPAYTLWLLTGFISAMVMSRERSTGHVLNYAGLAISSCYLAWTVAAKVIIDTRAERLLTAQGIVYDKLMSTPAPFNTLVWRIIGRVENGYFDAFLPVFTSAAPLEVNFHASDDALLNELGDHWPVQRLVWFTHGFYKVTRRGKDIVVTDLRMGLEGGYVFNFKVAESGSGGIIPMTGRLVP
jgi:inner membrane protein